MATNGGCKGSPHLIYLSPVFAILSLARATGSIVSASDNKRFRVVVVGVARGSELSAQDLAGSLTEYFPLAPDAQVAIETGRSAVVQVAESEYVARRAATMLIKLGAEIRIEPDDSSAGGMDFDEIDLGEIEDGLAGLGDNAPPPSAIPGAVLPDPVLVDRPPTVDDDAVTLTPQPSVSHRAKRTTRELDPVDPSAAPPNSEAEQTPQETTDETTDAAPPADERGQLVRCPAHGLLYDATQSPGCIRCLGPSAEQPFRIAPELRKRPRLWLTLGLALGLLLGAVPAALYAQNVKSSTLYERRIEADAIRRTRSKSKHFKKQYSKAQAKITATRNRGIAICALIWIGIAAGLMLLWYRFV